MEIRLGAVVGVFALTLSGCASLPFSPAAKPEPAPTAAASLLSDDDDWSQVVAQLRADLNRYNSREIVRKPTIAPSTSSAQARNREFSERANALFTPLSGTALRMPVVGIRNRDLSDSWHDPRDGGARQGVVRSPLRSGARNACGRGEVVRARRFVARPPRRWRPSA